MSIYILVLITVNTILALIIYKDLKQIGNKYIYLFQFIPPIAVFLSILGLIISLMEDKNSDFEDFYH